MMQQPLPTAARRAANHCSALKSQREAPVELGPEFEQFGERLAAALQGCVADVANDREARVVSLGAQNVAGAQLAECCAPLVASSRHLFGMAGNVLHLALDGRAILEQLDRTFGGTGKVGDTLPAQLPHTAGLLAQRLEKQVLAAIAGQLGGLDFRSVPGVAGDRRAPFAAGAELTVLTLEVAAAGAHDWRIVLAVETAALSSLLPKRASAQRAAISRRKRGIDEAPFADLPLSASARLVDMAMPLHRLADIRPGTMLPIMVARNVPLQVGEIVLARGTVGEVDDQVALQITQTFTGQNTTGKDPR